MANPGLRSTPPEGLSVRDKGCMASFFVSFVSALAAFAYILIGEWRMVYGAWVVCVVTFAVSKIADRGQG